MKLFQFYLFILSLCYSFAYAGQTQSMLFKFIHLSEMEHEQCSIRAGKMIMVGSSNTKQTLEVQMERYFMDIRQGGRSVVILRPDTGLHEMGCSRVLTDGSKQSWKIVQVKIIGD
ncbi:MAG: hypothetical protein COA83_03880 [Methylophaga sp.]|nr:MAG: hypothetical protein COA83_03880 [Methylophaga sp.]